MSIYARGRDYHKVLRTRLQRLADRLAERIGPFGHRVFTDSAPVLEVELAAKSGVGWRGKHTLVLARDAVEASEAELKIAHDLVSFTELKADAPGVVTATGPRAGEVLQIGQMIVKVARQGGRDAVFDVSAQVMRLVPGDPEVTVTLADDPSVTARGRVREVGPQANPVTRTFTVKVGLTDPPAAMRLGATVTGRVQREALATIEIPSTALTKFNRQPAVWIVDPSTQAVSIRNVDVLRYAPALVAISGGLDVGEIVVTAGVQALHPGQKVRLLGSTP